MPDTIGPIILPNAANDCDIPLTRPKYFFSVELFIIKLISTTDNVANEPFIIKKIQEIIDKIVLFKILKSDNKLIQKIDKGFNICTMENNFNNPKYFFNKGINIIE